MTGDHVRDLAAAGLAPFDRDDLLGARTAGVTGGFARAVAAAGHRVSLAEPIDTAAMA